MNRPGSQRAKIDELETSIFLHAMHRIDVWHEQNRAASMDNMTAYDRKRIVNAVKRAFVHVVHEVSGDKEWVIDAERKP